MKSPLRKINRGLILSAAVILGIAIYYLGIFLQTAPEREPLRQTVSGFFQVLSESAVVPSEYLRDGITETEVAPLLRSIKEKFQPYFASQKDLDYFMDSYVKSTVYNQTVYPSQLIKEKSFTFKKNEGLKLDSEKNTATLTAAVKFANNMVYYDLRQNADGTVSKAGSSSSNYSWDTEVPVQLVKQNEKWLIVSVSNLY